MNPWKKEGVQFMDSTHCMLLRSLFEGGSIRMIDIVESQRILDDLVDAGLVEIARPCRPAPDRDAPSPEYRLTPKGRAIAQFARSG